ncbi:MAG: hypothetical protein ACR2P0_11675 [Acidimicrobiales bacterium]
MRNRHAGEIMFVDATYTTDVLRFVEGLVRHGGARAVSRLPMEMWPLWDTNVAVLAFADGEPYFQSSAYAHLVGASGRQDFVDVPEIGSSVPAVDLETPPRWGSSGRWSVLCLTDLLEPLEYSIPGDDLLLHPDGVVDSMQCIKAGAQAAWGIRARGVHLFDAGGTVVLPELSRSLGYAIDDASWIPDHWRKPLRFGPVEGGVDRVVTGDGVDVELSWQRLRLTGQNVYWVRLELD